MSPKPLPQESKRMSLRVGGIIALLVIIAGATLIVIQFATAKFQPVDGERLAHAVAQYTRDCQERGGVRPKSVTLSTLLDLGYLTADDAKPWEGAEVTFFGDAVASNPKAILVEARMPDGQVQVVLADGSVQQWTAQKWAEYRRLNAPTNASKSPERPENSVVPGRGNP